MTHHFRCRMSRRVQEDFLYIFRWLLYPRNWDDNRSMVLPTFQSQLPEVRLSQKERNKRVRILAKFAKKLRGEIKAADLDHGADIRHLLVYIRKRLELLEALDNYVRLFERFDFLLGHNTQPVSHGIFGVAAGVTVDLALKDTVRMIRCLELRIESQIAEIILQAPAIDRLLDRSLAEDIDSFELRPASCLPEQAILNQEAATKPEGTPEFRSNQGPLTEATHEANISGDQAAVLAGLMETRPAKMSPNKGPSNSSRDKVSGQKNL